MWTTAQPATVTPAGADTQVQYNASGALAAEAGFTYDQATDRLTVVNSTATTARIVGSSVVPANPAAGNVDLYAFSTPHAGHLIPTVRYPIGVPAPLQGHLGYGRHILVEGGGATLNPVGMTVTTVGTLAARNVTTASGPTRLRRTSFTSAAGAGSLASVRGNAIQLFVGDGTSGGFHWTCRFACTDTATVSGARQIVAVINGTGAPSNTSPASNSNFIGIGNDAADTNMVVYHGASSITAVNLGANFPANTLGVDFYQMDIYCPPAGGGTWRVVRLNTGDVATGTMAANQLPAPSVALNPLFAGRTNNATAAAVAWDLVSLSVETFDV